MRKLASLAALLVSLTCSTGAWTEGLRGRGVTSSMGTSGVLAMGRSVGSPTAGHLVGGARLGDAPYLRIVPAYANGDVRWGLGSLVGMIDRAASRVRKSYNDAVLSVGHISRPGGGEVDRHRSHESGRDADIGFYVRNAQGKPIFADHFVSFRGDGTAPTWPGAYFDDARNWALVKALLTDPQARVSHIFVASPLKARLLAYAAKSGAPIELRNRAALAMLQPHGALPHDDHFHVRISCPAWQRECVEVALRKKPALVAKVPVGAKGRARAQAPIAAEAKKPATKSAVEGAASAVAPPAARILEPLRVPSAPHVAPPAPDAPDDTDRPNPDSIDDVDGPM